MAKKPGRPRLRGGGRKKKLFTRRPYTYEFKLEVINHLREHDKPAETLARYFPLTQPNTRQLLYKWKNIRALIEERASSTTTADQCRSRAAGTGTVLSEEVEAAIVEWINDYRRDAVPISASMLRFRALEVAEEAGIPRCNFAALYQWRRRFLKRHRLSFRAKTHQGQTSPPDAMQRAVEFAQEVRRRADAEDVVTIYNADQTGLFFEVLPRTTISPTGASTVWVKCGKKEKERMTAMVLGDMDGNRYPHFLVLKATSSTQPETHAINMQQRHGFGRYVWKDVEPLQAAYNVRIFANRTAWWNGALTMEFLRFHFGERSVFIPAVMLLLDDFSGHWVPEIKEYAVSLNVVLVKVPPGLTWLCQPADAVWIKPMKDRTRQHWVSSLQTQLSEHRVRQDGLAFQMRAPDREVVVKWASDAWDGISANIIRAGFRKCMLDDSFPSGDPLDEEDGSEQQVAINDVLEELEGLSIVDSTTPSVSDKDDVVDNGSADSDENDNAE